MRREMGLVRGVPRANVQQREVRTLEPVPSAVCLVAEHHLLEVAEVRSFPQFNPSVCVRDGELLATVRVQVGACSDNYLGLVKGWSFARTSLIHEFPRTVHGYEDLRLFELEGQLKAVCSIFNGVKSQIAVIGLSDGDGEGTDEMETLFESEAHEKNWMPLVDGDRLRLVRSLSPLDVVDYATHRGPLKPIEHMRLRGGSQLIKHEGKWVGIAHKTYWTDSGRVYLHHVVTLDDHLGDLRVGPPFYFQKLGIEFCAGLAWHEGWWVLSFGLEDREAWLAVSDLNEVMP